LSTYIHLAGYSSFECSQFKPKAVSS